MEQAVHAVTSGSMGYKRAAFQFNVPQSTLERYVAKERADADYTVVKSLCRFTSVFNKNQEEELVAYLHKIEAQLFGLTVKELRKLAFQLAERNKIIHPFIHEAAGLDLARGFLISHQELTLRKPEAASAARAMGFNVVAVQKFYELLINVVDSHHLTADRI